MPTKQGKKKKRGRPRILRRFHPKSAKQGLREDLTRVTFVVREDHLKKLKDLSNQSHLPLKDVLELALDSFFKSKVQMEKVLKKGVAGSQYCTVKELAKILDVTPITVRSYINSGDIPAKKVGKDWVVNLEGLKKTKFADKL